MIFSGTCSETFAFVQNLEIQIVVYTATFFYSKFHFSKRPESHSCLTVFLRVEEEEKITVDSRY